MAQEEIALKRFIHNVMRLPVISLLYPEPQDLINDLAGVLTNRGVVSIIAGQHDVGTEKLADDLTTLKK